MLFQVPAAGPKTNPQTNPYNDRLEININSYANLRQAFKVDVPIDRNSVEFKTGDALLKQEQKLWNDVNNYLMGVKKAVSEHNAINPDIKNALLSKFEAYPTLLVGSVAKIDVVIAQAQSAPSQAGFDAAVLDFNASRMAAKEFFSPQRVKDAETALALLPGSGEFITKIKQLGALYASDNARTNGLTNSQAIGGGKAEGDKTPKVEAVTDLQINKDYEQKVTASKSAPLKVDKKIGLEDAFSQEGDFLTSIALAEKKGDKSTIAQLEAIEERKPGFRAKLSELGKEYAALGSDPSESAMLAQSQKFRKTMSSFNSGAVGKLAEGNNTIAKTIVRMTAYTREEARGIETTEVKTEQETKAQEAAAAAATKREQEREDSRQKQDAPDSTGITARNDANSFFYKNGFVPTMKGKLQFRDNTKIPEDQAANALKDAPFTKVILDKTVMDYESVDPAQAYRANRAAMAAIKVMMRQEIKNTDYPELRDYLAPGAKVINFIATLGWLNKAKDGREVNEKFLDKNRLQGLLSKLEINDKILSGIVEVSTDSTGKTAVDTRAGLTDLEMKDAFKNAPQMALAAKNMFEQSRQLVLDAGNGLINNGRR